MENTNNEKVYLAAPERSNWRCQWISTRHREWGGGVPFTDVDCILSDDVTLPEDLMGIEYDNEIPYALIEYKDWNANINLNHTGIKTQKYIADNLRLPDGSFGIPFFVVVYNKDYHVFHVIPMNEKAKKVPWCQTAKDWTERNYVRMLYWLRKKKCPQHIENNMWTKKLPEFYQCPKIS